LKGKEPTNDSKSPIIFHLFLGQIKDCTLLEMSGRELSENGTGHESSPENKLALAFSRKWTKTALFLFPNFSRYTSDRPHQWRGLSGSFLRRALMIDLAIPENKLARIRPLFQNRKRDALAEGIRLSSTFRPQAEWRKSCQ